jgi:hypothetical protein
MIAGSVFFDVDFHFHDGENGKKLFIVLGTEKGIVVIAKTTSQPYGKGINCGCQPNDRFHNFYLPHNYCCLKKATWVCLNEFYEFKESELLQKRFGGKVNHICDLLPEITQELQDCAIDSNDISTRQKRIIVSTRSNNC